MLFKIGDTVYSPNDLPCAVVFANDEERKRMIEILQNMKEKPGEVRWFCQNPSELFTPESFDKWSELTAEQRLLMVEGAATAKIEL